MCDKKYMDEKEGLANIQDYMKESLTDEEMYVSSRIMETMSYSKVKANGYPDLGEYQTAYHIVRESDLLAAYDFERSLMYHMCTKQTTIHDALVDANAIFATRILRHNNDHLFVSDYGLAESMRLHEQSIVQMGQWNRLLLSS
jgi:hypothetical protein